jgi:hypothetical protein
MRDRCSWRSDPRARSRGLGSSRRSHRLTIRRIAAGAILAAAAPIGLPAAPAVAQGTEPDCVNPINPDTTDQRRFCRVRQVAVTAQAGDKLHVQSRLVLDDMEQRLLLEHVLRCDLETGHTIRTTQNSYAGQDRAMLHARYIWTAPADGGYVCELLTRVAYPAAVTGPADVHVRTGESTLTVQPAPDWAAHKFQDSERIIGPQQWDLLAMYWTAPNGLAAFDVTGDVELTNCYGPYQGSNRTDGVACTTSPSNGNSSTVETRVQALQIATDGSYCRTTSSPMDRITISWAVHHKKNYGRLTGIPVSTAAGCTRRFRLKVFARHVAGNPSLVEVRPYSNLYVHGGN